jgi:type IV pilus assembly protein PilB
MTFLDELAQRGIIEQKQILEVKRRANEAFGGDIDQALIELGMSEKNLISLKSAYFNIPSTVVDITHVTPELLKYIPKDTVDHYQFVPIGLQNGILEVGIVDPDNIAAMDALRFVSGKSNVPFKLFIVSPSDFKQAVTAYRQLTAEVDQALSEFNTESLAQEDTDLAIEQANIQQSLAPGEEERIVEEAPIIKIVAVIIRHAIEGEASDIHIENGGDKVKVRFRVDGVLHTSLVLPLNVYAGVIARVKILSKLRLDEKRKPQDGNFSAKIDGRKIDFRVSTLPTYYGEKVVIRILDSEKGVRSLEQLNMSKRNLDLIRNAIKRPYGLILVTGPTGSGKSTTLYSLINELDRETANVVSLEDPVEYHIPDMNQSQVMPEIGYTFASGLRSILRQDPNIIMVGEIRDKETAELAIQAALTGHLVISTLHTNNAIGVIPRLVDMGVDPYLIAPTLILSVAQRLSRVICPSSKKAVPVDESTKMFIDKQFTDLPEEFKKELPFKSEVHEAVPSAECSSGVKGRQAIFEMFVVDKEMQSIILKNPVEPEIYKAARAKGMITMKEDAILKSMEGVIPFNEVYNFN